MTKTKILGTTPQGEAQLRPTTVAGVNELWAGTTLLTVIYAAGNRPKGWGNANVGLYPTPGEAALAVLRATFSDHFTPLATAADRAPGAGGRATSG